METMILVISSIVILAVTFGQTTPPYNPPDSIALDCGSPEGSRLSRSRRKWKSDVNNVMFSPRNAWNADSSPVLAANDTDKGVDVPYRSARVSALELRYTFRVVPGPKFIRLHFYAASLNASMAFSVRAGEYDLFFNFTGALATVKTVVKEYIVPVEGSSVTIAFTPFPGKMAFVNGIEVVSMPYDLYYTANALSVGLKWVKEQSRYFLRNDTALEMMYRVDVGAERGTPPAEDTGMFRSWETESPYLSIPGYSFTSVIPTSVRLKFAVVPNYTAPETVYKTIRWLGNKLDAALQTRYNLTWEFPVDPGFTYMLRLHFCPKDKRVYYDRSFQIFIANRTAEDQFNAILLTQGEYIPIFVDYVVAVVGVGKQNLTLALHAYFGTMYVDPSLNGLEIFKLSDSTHNLGLVNPNFAFGEASREDPPNKKIRRKSSMISIIAGVACGAVLMAFIGALFLRRGRKIKNKSRYLVSSTDSCRCFSLSEIKAATNNFDDMSIIGHGGFGNVYKGYTDDGRTPVAIKRLKPESSQGAHEFETEIETLSHLRHRNLVSLIGYCHDRNEMILVYEYMPRGTLRDHLYDSKCPPLTWQRRLEACISAAHGLHYLHTGTKHVFIHRDVKTTNILLDKNWVAKVSDFGLTRVGPTTVSKSHVSTQVKGSFGYLDPEYYQYQRLSEKSDVYSFGVVLCEVLCGRPPILHTAEWQPDVSLANWAKSCHRNGTLNKIVDPNLAGEVAPECLREYGEIAIQCMLDNSADRPSMKDVISALDFVMQIGKVDEKINVFIDSSEISNIESLSAMGESLTQTWISS